MSTSKNILLNPKANGVLNTLKSNITSLPASALPIQEIYKFHSSLPGYTQTPLLSLPLSLHTPGKIHLKDERIRYGLPSFKPLGITWAIRNALIDELNESSPSPISSDISLAELASKTKEAQITLVTATDGKLGRIVARVGKYFGVESVQTRVFVESELDEGVKEGIRKEGAEVIEVEGEFEQVVREAWLHSVATDGVLISVEEEENYVDFPGWIIEGYSTIFKEIDEQLKRAPDVIIVPVGVGGLAQAAVTHYKTKSQEVAQRTYIVTVEPSGAASLHESIRAGKRVTVEPGNSIVKHLNYGTISEKAWEVLKDGVDVSVVVEDEDVKIAMKEVSSHGVDVGACSGAVVSALKSLLDSDVGQQLGVNSDSSIVLIATDSIDD